MEMCKFIDNSNESYNCKSREQYGNHCRKHRRFHLIEGELLNIKRFTFQEKDYLLKDLSKYYHTIIDSSKTNKTKYKKHFYFVEICEFINRLNSYEEPKIIIIQSLLRRKLISNKSNKSNNCNNSEDFYTYDPIDEIDNNYFYSYKDKQGFNWGFDCRSLIKLIKLNYPNPYTIEAFPDKVIVEVNEKIKLLKKQKLFVDIEEIILRDRKSTIKQKVVDIFSDIELNGYSCRISWFFDLSGRRLKELFKQLEDLWNYRAQLSNESKINICPPTGANFSTPISDVLGYNCKEDLQELIINDISKFKNAIDLSNRKLGYMYFIIGLSTVSTECYLTHQDWVTFVQ